MRNLIVILLLIFFNAINLNAQTLCPNLFKCGDNLIDPRDTFSYPTVLIGTQCWLQVNLQSTKYVNGDSIPHITNGSTWQNLTTGAWCDYNNDPGNGVIYGHIYNFFTTIDARGLCPAGWYVPSYDEWMVLINYLGGVSLAGGAMKEAGTALWSSNTGATNSSGFTALPGGYLCKTCGCGSFCSLNSIAHYWSSTQTAGSPYYFYLDGGLDANLYYNMPPASGVNVRCVKEY